MTSRIWLHTVTSVEKTWQSAIEAMLIARYGVHDKVDEKIESSDGEQFLYRVVKTVNARPRLLKSSLALMMEMAIS